jgi:DMSO/TMAO reductase YedYZ molybdopterin-dependent catalytic subunit
VSEQRLPPSQHLARGWPVVHYGPVPKARPEQWDLRCFGALATGEQRRFTPDEFAGLPRSSVRADLHCVTKFSLLQNEWYGVTAQALLDAAPPADDVTHVMVWAEYGYSANMRLADFAAPASILATHRDGEPLTPEHGWPLRLVVPSLYAWKSAKWVRAVEYLTADRRGFWEERGYHNVADPWREQRYSYQEDAGDGPPLR